MQDHTELADTATFVNGKTEVRGRRSAAFVQMVKDKEMKQEVCVFTRKKANGRNSKFRIGKCSTRQREEKNCAVK